MQIDSTINAWITEKDWSHLDAGPVLKEHYDRLYSKVMVGLWENRADLSEAFLNDRLYVEDLDADLLLTDADLDGLSDADIVLE